MNAESKLRLTRASLFFLVCLLTASGRSGVALALDPDKAITQYAQTRWQTEEGLPQDSARAILQTRDGYLWIGTEEGVARFDGVRFIVFDQRNTAALKNNRVNALLESSDGSLWIGTNGGLTRYNGQEFTSYTTHEGLSNDHVNSVFESSDGSLWIGTYGGGLSRLFQGTFTSYTTKDGIGDDRIMFVYGDSGGNIWLYTEGGLTKYKEGRFTNYTTKDGLPINNIRSIYEDPHGVLWIATDGGGLARFAEGRFTTYSTKEGLPDDKVQQALSDSDGNLWVCTLTGGLARFNDGRFTIYSAKEGLPNNHVRAIYEDRERNLWIGMAGGGLLQLKDGSATPFGTLEGLRAELVWCVMQGRDGSIWLGTNGGGLGRLKDGKLTTHTTKDGLSNDNVRSLYEDRDGSLWIGTSGKGLNRFKDGRFSLFNPQSEFGVSNSSNLRVFYADSDHNLWIGLEGGGLRLFRNGNFTRMPPHVDLATLSVSAIIARRDGSLWIATNRGLSHFHNGDVTGYTTREGLSSNSLMSLMEDRDGVLWIGTLGGGLNRLKDGNFTAYTTKDGLFDDNVWQILEDNVGNLWMSSNKGIFRVGKKDLEDFAEGRAKSVTSISYGTADGMRTRECNGDVDPAGYKTTDGRLWFPTNRGAVIIDPGKLKTNSLPPPVVLDQLFVDKSLVSTRGAVTLPAGKKDFEFHYTGLSFSAPEKVRFRYKLEGFDQDWVEADNRRVAYYTNIPPGGYRFRVMACNNDGVWNESGATFEFYLQPHFYETRWFYALCALAVILAGFGLYRLRVRQLRRRTRELEVVVDQRTAELKSSQQKVLTLEKQATEQLMAGGFAHEMRNALAGSKLILDQALALDGREPHISLNLANCRNLKEIYLGLKDKLPEDDTRVVLQQMQTIFANEERLDEVMQLVRKATSRGLNITQQIMDYSKMGQQQPGQQSVDLHNLIVSIVNESREEFSSQGVVVGYKSGPQMLSLIGDETHFYSIFKNIILNARDALIDPSLSDMEDRRIEITTRLEGDMCSVVIADNGIGIPRENLQKMFEPFFSTKPATGTGLGLGMVKKMVSLYNGRIDVSSEAGKGTCVTISLPVSW